MTEFKQPFFSTIFTISSHNPYIIPEKYKGKFSKGTTKIHESIAYADNALKRFFETASKEDWYKITLFVITSDHTSSEPTEKNSKQMLENSECQSCFSTLQIHQLWGKIRKTCSKLTLCLR